MNIGAVDGLLKGSKSKFIQIMRMDVKKVKRYQLLVVLMVQMVSFLFSSNLVFAYPVEWKVDSGGNGHYYWAISLFDENKQKKSITWEDAKIAAEEAGGYLATITSEAENQIVYSLLQDRQYWSEPAWGENSSTKIYRAGPWLGGYQNKESSEYSEPGGGWSWITGEPWIYSAWKIYSAWAAKEPNNAGGDEYCLHYIGQGTYGESKWNDLSNISSGLVNSYVVEFNDPPKVPEPATMLLLGLGLVGLAGARRKIPGKHYMVISVGFFYSLSYHLCDCNNLYIII